MGVFSVFRFVKNHKVFYPGQKRCGKWGGGGREGKSGLWGSAKEKKMIKIKPFKRKVDLKYNSPLVTVYLWDMTGCTGGG